MHSATDALTTINLNMRESQKSYDDKKSALDDLDFTISRLKSEVGNLKNEQDLLEPV